MRVAIYCRLSEEDKDKLNEQDDSHSIQNQKSLLIQYAMDRDWEINKIYSDDDYTGADRKRPEFSKLLEDAEQHKFDIILCKSQARFTRELELVEKYLHGLFPLWNIRFIGVADSADTAIKGNKKSRQINGLVNEWYLEDLSDNIKTVLDDRRSKGFHIGAFALYGYIKDPEIKGHLIVDEEAAAIVREVFTLFLQGVGKTAIARMLNDRGVPNPTEYKRLKGLRYQQPKSKYSTLWQYFAISNMLSNEIYIGNMVQGKYGSISYKSKINRPRPKEMWHRVENTHEPIIDYEVWNQVQILISKKTKPVGVGREGLFARKARCMYCRCTMRSSKTRDTKYLKCAKRHVAKDICIGAFISVPRLEQAVINELNRLSEEYLNIEQLENQVDFSYDFTFKKETLVKEVALHQKKIGEFSSAIKALYMDKVKGIISEEEYIEFSKDFNKEKKKLELLIADLYASIEDMESKINAGDNRRQLIEQYTTVKQLDRSIVEELIDFILVGKRIPGTRDVPVEIHWNF